MAINEQKALEPDGAPPGPTEDELFCDYLSARLGQALDALNQARDTLIANPQDYHRAMEVMRKVYDLRDLKKQLEHQRGRVNAAREAAGLAPVVDSEPAISTSPTEGFRVAQAAQAGEIMATLQARPQTCPACQALLAADATQCTCGHRPSPAAPASDGAADAPGLQPPFVAR
jgi:hypothetical protein